ncbi:MAG: rRNA processing protein RimM [Bacteroidota bacterium]|jgi:16S rRNA processing protein RimM
MLNNNIHSRPTQQVGFVLKPHGFNGQLKIQLEEDFIPQAFLCIEIQDKFVPFKIKQFNAPAGIVTLEDISNIEQAEALCNCKILDFVDQEQTENKGLVGYKLINHANAEQYDITQILEYPNNLLLECRHGYKDILIPLHEDLIVSVDHEAKTIEMTIPEGLLDL